MGIFRDIEISFGYIAHTIYRFFQFVLAITVCGLYGVDLHKADQSHVYSDGKWVYAEVVASISALTAILYMIPFASRIPFAFVWDTILFMMWIVLFGIFGHLYIPAHAMGDAGIQRMKNAVWVDLVNALLWFISAIGLGIYWVRHRNNPNHRSEWTGRARV